MQTDAAPLPERMADAIVSAFRERGFCRARDLEAQGFAPEEIGHCWAQANALAAVELMPEYFNIIDGGRDEQS